MLSVTGPDPDTPTKAGLPIADLSAGLFVTVGVLAALRRAEQTGVGGRVEVSLAEACGALLSNQALNHLIGGTTPQAMGNAHPNVAPYQVVQAADRGIAIAAASELQFGRLCVVLGAPDLAQDPRFATNALRVEHREALVTELERYLAGRPAADWVVALNKAGVAAAPINTVPEMFGDPDTRAGLVATVPTTTGARCRSCARRSASTGRRWPRPRPRRASAATTPRSARRSPSADAGSDTVSGRRLGGGIGGIVRHGQRTEHRADHGELDPEGSTHQRCARSANASRTF